MELLTIDALETRAYASFVANVQPIKTPHEAVFFFRETNRLLQLVLSQTASL
jgi:hypothetical protein